LISPMVFSDPGVKFLDMGCWSPPRFRTHMTVRVGVSTHSTENSQK
jgi:hypothetical protein